MTGPTESQGNRQAARLAARQADQALRSATEFEEGLRTPTEIRLFGLAWVGVGAFVLTLEWIATSIYGVKIPQAIGMVVMLPLAAAATWGLHALAMGRHWRRSPAAVRVLFLVVGAVLSLVSMVSVMLMAR